MVAFLFIIFLISLWSPGHGNAIYQTSEALCGASILNERFVLSAAHCYRLGTKEIVIVGTHNSNEHYQNYSVEKSIIHPKYILSDEYDVLVLKLAIKLTYSGKVRPIKMADPGLVIQIGTKLEAFGFGQTSYNEDYTPPYLRKVVVPYVSSEECNDIYKPKCQITKTMLCAGEFGKDTCKGDSGGPLVYNNTLVGVVSFGYGCGIAPGVYGRVSALRDFIDDAILRNS